jgi:hypothetical protein
MVLKNSHASVRTSGISLNATNKTEERFTNTQLFGPFNSQSHSFLFSTTNDASAD